MIIVIVALVAIMEERKHKVSIDQDARLAMARPNER